MNVLEVGFVEELHDLVFRISVFFHTSNVVQLCLCGIQDNAADTSMTVTASIICVICIYCLVRAYRTTNKMKLAATTQVTFVALTFVSSLCSASFAVLPLAGVHGVLASDLIDHLRVVMDFWTNTYLMIFWLKVHFFVRYRSETTLNWLWWIWASLNFLFVVFNITLCSLSIAAFMKSEKGADTKYYDIRIVGNFIAYVIVPVLVGVFGYQLYGLFKRWGRAFNPSLSHTLKRIAIGTTVVCVCFLLRAIILLMVMLGVFEGDNVSTSIYLFYYQGLTALPQLIALYVMAILLPRQRVGESEGNSMVSGGESGPSRNQDNLHNLHANSGYFDSRNSPMSQNYIHDNDDGEPAYDNTFDEDNIYGAWNERSNSRPTNNRYYHNAGDDGTGSNRFATPSHSRPINYSGTQPHSGDNRFATGSGGATGTYYSQGARVGGSLPEDLGEG